MLRILISCAALLIAFGCSKPSGSQPKASGGPSGFQKTFPDFLKKMENPKTGAYYSMRVLITKDGVSESVWVRYASKVKGTQYEAMLANDPKLLKGLDHTDSVTFDIKDVNDWMIINPDNSVEGAFSSKVTPR